MHNAVGFYWTLPVPWAGFTALPEDIDAAAKASRTVRYQRELIRRHVKELNLRLVAEKVFLEIEPDRGSQYILDALRPLEGICRADDSVLLYVDFSEVQGWRSHSPLSAWARRTSIRVETVYPDDVMIDGETYDPHRHFSEWRERQNEWTASREERVARALDIAGQLRAEGRTHKEIVAKLNVDNVRSASGKPWSEDGVRGLLKKKLQT